ncbi:uncharacterized protein LOC119277723 [Triticum dicoccoides]|uniref:uncharacterized protein LOC119277723 n=1 Tax=Triticum dicoccoides TaxID=85692 RepID=UPI00188FE145|nr:uncharacterized protein LOC119277723 [Triticum dicoccoides]
MCSCFCFSPERNRSFEYPPKFSRPTSPLSSPVNAGFELDLAVQAAGDRDDSDGPFFCAAHGGLEATSGRTGMSRPRCCGRGGFLTVDRGQPHRLALLPGTARATFSSLYAEC